MHSLSPFWRTWWEWVWCEEGGGKALSHKTSSHYILIKFSLRSHYVLQNVLGMGWPPETFEQVQSSGYPSPFRKFKACPGGLYYAQEIRTQFEFVQKNAMQISLVWRKGGGELPVNTIFTPQMCLRTDIDFWSRSQPSSLQPGSTPKLETISSVQP